MARKSKNSEEKQSPEKNHRHSDKAAKAAFRKLLEGMPIFSGCKIDSSSKTTDIIVHLGEDNKNWYYFELKTTTKEVLKKNNKYFGAISLNQWKEALKHKGHYYFVLVMQDDSTNPATFKYILKTPLQLFEHITGCYVHTDFNIFVNNESVDWIDGDSIKTLVTQISTDIRALQEQSDKSNSIKPSHIIAKEQLSRYLLENSDTKLEQLL